MCLPCQDLMSSLTVKHDDKYHSRRGDLSGSFDKFEDEKDKEVEVEEEDKACNLSNDQEKKGIKFSCPQCSNTFQSQLKMVRHASKKHGLYLPMPLKAGLERCPFCVEIFNEGSPFFLAHLKYSHPEERENQLCKEIMERISVMKYICSSCGKDFLTNRALELHTVEVHSSHVNTVP